MALTIKDLKIINTALAFYESEIDVKQTLMWEYHAEVFGNPLKTLEATRNRVHKEISKKEREGK